MMEEESSKFRKSSGSIDYSCFNVATSKNVQYRCDWSSCGLLVMGYCRSTWTRTFGSWSIDFTAKYSHGTFFQIVQDVYRVWEKMMNERQGLYSYEESPPSPLAPSEKTDMKLQISSINPHRVLFKVSRSSISSDEEFCRTLFEVYWRTSVSRYASERPGDGNLNQSLPKVALSSAHEQRYWCSWSSISCLILGIVPCSKWCIEKRSSQIHASRSSLSISLRLFHVNHCCWIKRSSQLFHSVNVGFNITVQNRSLKIYAMIYANWFNSLTLCIVKKILKKISFLQVDLRFTRSMIDVAPHRFISLVDASLESSDSFPDQWALQNKMKTKASNDTNHHRSSSSELKRSGLSHFNGAIFF